MKKQHLVLLIPSLLFLSGCETKFEYSFTENNEYKLYVNLKYGDANRNVLDLALPKENSHRGLVFYIHGGGWIAGDKDGYRESLISYAKKGYACAALNYRYADQKSVTGFEILDDIDKALTKVKETAESSNINLEKALLSGGSAGGHLSLLYAYSRVENAPIKPSCVVSYCGPSDLVDPNFYKTDVANYKAIMNMISKVSGKSVTSSNYYSEYKDVLKSLSPIYYVNNKTVPTVICHGPIDELVPYSNALSLDEVLTKNNVEHELVTFKNSGHGLENDANAKARSDELFTDYVEKYLA